MSLLVAPLLVLACTELVAPEAAAGDPRHVAFVQPFEQALARSRSENRMLFLKPVYGGMDREGAEDYRTGQW